jgi:hypothetical protein
MAAERAAASAAGCGEVEVDVEEHGAGDVPGLVGLAPAAGGIDVPPRVHDAQGGIAQVRGQPFRPGDRVQGEARGTGDDAGRRDQGDSTFL